MHTKPRMPPVIVGLCQAAVTLGSLKVLFWKERERAASEFLTNRNWWKPLCEHDGSFFWEEIFFSQIKLNSIRASKWKYMMTHIYIYATWLTPMNTYLFKPAFLFPLEIKWCKVRSVKIYKVDSLITDAQDWIKWNLCPTTYSWNCPVMIL